MREIDAIVAAYKNLKNEQVQCVLATVVQVEGSSYRRAGARMLVDEFGNLTGSISGGCLEGDALRKALHALHHQKNKLVTYDTSDEDDAVIGAQLGCNGVIKVLFEAINYQVEKNPCELLAMAVHEQQKAAILIEFNLDETKEQVGTTGLIYSEEKKNTISGIPENMILKAVEVIKQAQSSLVQIASNTNRRHLFIEYYEPALKLVLVGAGNDAMILSRQAELLGWKVLVADGRPTHANSQRFSSGCQIIVTKPEETLNHIKIDDRCYFVLMSHNYHYDLAVLQVLLDINVVPYIGILGPLKKWDRMKEDLLMAGMEITNEHEEKIHAPIGLELGAETPAEIGLSVLAEVQKVLTRTNGQSLKFKKSPIHNRKPVGSFEHSI